MAGMRLLILICGRDEVHFNVEIILIIATSSAPPLRKSFFVSIFCGWGISASKELKCHLTFIAMVEMFRGP